MLARLTAAAGSARVEIDRSGAVLKIAPAAASEAVLRHLEVLGVKAAPAASAPAGVERWLGAGDVKELTREEWQVFAGQWAEGVKDLDDPARAKLRSALERELSSAVDRTPDIHEGTGLANAHWRRSQREAIARAVGELDPAVRGKVQASLQAIAFDGDPQDPPESTPVPDLRWAAPVLRAADVGKSAEWYRDVLGFSSEVMSPDFAIVSIGDVRIMLQKAEPKTPRPPRAHFDAYLEMKGIQAYHDAVRARAKVLDPLEKKPYGTTEFSVEDPDGHRIVFAESDRP